MTGDAESDALSQGLGARRRLSALLAAAIVTAGLPQVAAAQGAAVTLEQARAEHEGGRALLVDIREPDEHAAGVAPGARLLPMRQLGRRIAELPRDRPVLLICNTQNRSRATYEALRERGYTNLRYVSGGMSEWVRRGWKVTSPAP